MSDYPKIFQRCLMTFLLLAWGIGARVEAGVSVNFDQTVYVVSGPGSQLVATVTFDGDDAFPGYQGIRDGLYSCALRINYPEGKVAIGMKGIILAPPLDNNGFDTAPASRKIGAGYASVEGIIGFTNKYYSPEATYYSDPAGSWPMIAQFVITNLALPGESFQVSLDMPDSVRSNYWYCAYNKGKNAMLIDDQISFGAATIHVNNRPYISAISDQVVEFNTSTEKIPFTIGDQENSELSISAYSDNPFLVPNENIIFAGMGTNRTVVLTPFKGESGKTTITLTVSDGQLTAQTKFNITVNPKIITPIRFIQMQKLTNDFVRITFTAASLTELRLEATSDLINWVSITNMTMTGSSMEIIDSIVDPGSMRFYRLSN